ncbi:DUF262 domain-containing protein [Lysinibacillus sp. NPDC047702]|uniref:DUF262 domain-containing protein n=1 Tax=unclassified Lysinibacillus TaxID=2636778 RepID=UPI003D09212D
MSTLVANTITLKNYLYLSNGILKIPYSQRPYEWSKAQAERLFNDFYSVYEIPSSSHVLNFITVYKENDDSKYIYDGQQRTVSSLLIVASLIKLLKDIGEGDSASKFVEKYLASPDEFDDRTFTYKLVFEKNSSQNVFNNYIVYGKNIPDTVELTDYEKALKTNYELFYNLFKEKLGTSPSASNIKLVLKNILENIILILIETSSEDVAIKMFDSLNSTGKQLADFYILKNYLVQILGEEAVKEKWENIESNTDGKPKNKFLVTYANAINGKTSEKNIFNNLKELKILEDRGNSSDFLEELEKASVSYLSLITPSLRSTTDTNQKTIFMDQINTLNTTLKAGQYRSVILAMDLKEFPLTDINRVLKEIISLQLRNIFIGQEPGNTLEQFYPDLAKSIYTNVIRDAATIIQKLNAQMLSDTLLIDKFKSKLIKTNNDKTTIKYVLRSIYNFEHQNRNQNEILINPDTYQITLEHILPERPDQSSNWVTLFDDSDREKYTFIIGNLTLLLRSPNASASNNEFSVKVNEYSQSAISHNKILSLKTSWTKDTIDQRTVELFNTFIKLWKKQ